MFCTIVQDIRSDAEIRSSRWLSSLSGKCDRADRHPSFVRLTMGRRKTPFRRAISH